MLDKTITAALLALRAQIIRGKLDGLDHVEALLALRGAALPHVRRMIPANSCGPGTIRMAIIMALRDGPKRPAQVAAAFHATHPQLPYAVACQRVYRSAGKMVEQGTVIRDGWLWRLA